MTSATELTARVRAARDTATKLVVYRIPENVLTVVAVSAAAIETFAGVTVDEIEDKATIEAALEAIERSEPVAADRPIDARTALVFFNSDRERVLRAYKGSFASRGQIDDESCEYRRQALEEWLAARYDSVAN